MYGTTIKSYNDNKSLKSKKFNDIKVQDNAEKSKKVSKKSIKKEQDTKYMRINSQEKTESVSFEKSSNVNEGFSFKDLPIASVVITMILTMVMLVLTSGFGGL